MTTPAVATPAKLRLRNPGDVLAAVPYVLGFHPADSLVVVGLRGKRFHCQVRGDLPPAGASPATLRALADHYTELFLSRGIFAVILVGYGQPERVTPMIEAAGRAMRRRGMRVHDMIRATGGRYWTYLCRNPDCCPPEGTSYDPGVTTVAAAATMAGCVALPDREAVVRSLAPPVGLALVAIEQATDRAAERLVSLLARGDRELAVADAGRFALDEACARYAAGGRLTDDEVAWLSVVLTLIHVRDEAWRRIDGEAGAQTHIRLWSDVLRRCEPQLAAGPGMLLAYAFWRDGELIRATVANDRALAANPDYSAAHLMAEVLDQGVQAETVPRLGEDLPSDPVTPTSGSPVAGAGAGGAADPPVRASTDSADRWLVNPSARPAASPPDRWSSLLGGQAVGSPGEASECPPGRWAADFLGGQVIGWSGDGPVGSSGRWPDFRRGSRAGWPVDGSPGQPGGASTGERISGRERGRRRRRC